MFVCVSVYEWYANQCQPSLEINWFYAGNIIIVNCMKDFQLNKIRRHIVN